MEIPKGFVPLLMTAMRDAVRYNDQLLKSETLRDRDDYEEHFLNLTQFHEYLKSEYKGGEYPVPLEKLID
jgi:hypothetical protein